MTNRLTFTKRRIEALPVPTDHVTYYYDIGVRGLRLAVHQSGRRTLSLYRKSRRRPVTYPLGEFPYANVDQARQQASEKIALKGRSVNPRDELERPTDPTLAQFFERYIKEHLDVRPDLEKGARRTLGRHLSRWKGWRLSEVTRADVERLHKEASKPVFTENAKTKLKRQRHGPVQVFI
jgi:hypothetical protein